MKKIVISFACSTLVAGSATYAADSVSILSITQGTVKASLAHSYYANTATNLGAWPLNTGGNYAISFENPQYQQNALVAFGNGGTVTMQFNTPFTPVAGEKDLGIFTAQAITNGAYALNGYMEAAILVSSDDQNWYNLSGGLVTNPTAYVTGADPLNAPTMAYDYGTDATAWNAGSAKLSAAQLGALPIADYLTPMPDDSLFNNPASTNAQRAALQTDSSTADYTEEFGNSGGGNWFDVSGSGLTSIDYVMLNGDANDTASNGIRLEDVFVNQNAVPGGNAVPEPASLGLIGLAAIGLLRKRTSRSAIAKTFAFEKGVSY